MLKKITISSFIFVGTLLALMFLSHYSNNLSNDLKYEQSMLPLGTNFLFKDKLLFKNKTEYDVEYLINKNSFRLTHSRCTNCKKHLVLLGDSYVFGQGLKDASILSAILESNYTDTQSYNWGKRGYSVADFAFENEVLPFNVLSQEEGRLYFIFQDFHFHRILYGSNQFRFFSPIINSYSLIGNRLTKAGWWGSYLVRINYIFYSCTFKILSLFNSKVPIGSKALTVSQLNESIEIAVHSLNIIKTKYLRSHPHGEFVVVLVAIDNSNVLDPSVAAMRRAAFEVQVININEWKKRFNELTFKDGHPKEEYNVLLSQYLK